MSDSNDERLKKLMVRTNDPLPNYSSEGANRGGKINFDESVSEGREIVGRELFSDKKSRKLPEMDSHRRAPGTKTREEASKQQMTLDAFNFYKKPVIESKKVKRVYSDTNKTDMLADLNSNNSDSNHSSQEARLLFSNGGKQCDKIDQYFGGQPVAFSSESKPFKGGEEYSQYVLRERVQYVEQMDKQCRRIEELKEENQQKTNEIKRLRDSLEHYQRLYTESQVHKNRISSIVLELESLKTIQKKTNLANLKLGLGYYENTSSVGGSKGENRSFWVDGQEILSKKKTLEQIASRKQQLENCKKSLKSTRRLSSGEQIAGLFDDTIDDELQLTYLVNGDHKDTAKRLDDVIGRLTSEEKDIIDQLEKLETERLKMVMMERTLTDESR